MTDQPDTPPNKTEPLDSSKLISWDPLLAKYVRVWLWSVLFGTNTGLLYTLSTLNSGGWKVLGVIIAIPAMFAGAYALLALLQLYRALRVYLLPEFVTLKGADPALFGDSLGRAMYFLIVASALRILAALFELALSALGGGGWG